MKKYINLESEPLIIGDYVVLTEEKMDDFDVEISLLKVVDKPTKTHISVLDLINTLAEDEVSIEYAEPFCIDARDVYKVKINSLNLFKNYIINSSLSWECNPNGEQICAIQIYNYLKKATTLEGAILVIKGNLPQFFDKSAVISDDEDFENTRIDYIETIEYLNELTKDELIEAYSSNPIYKFTEFDDSQF